MLILGLYSVLVGINSSAMIFTTSDIVVQFWLLFCMTNIALAIFNLIPIYPLDGYRFVKIISPKAGYRLEKNGFIITIVMLLLIL